MMGLNRNNAGIVIAASLGYLVDLFDTFLLPALQKPSLIALGVPSVMIPHLGTDLLNLQLFGQTLGALLLWGPLADRLGRRRVLFASILLYAAGNFATAYAHGVTSFAVMRFVTGLGLGGELGAGIALITETMAPEDRTKGTAIVGFFGMLGVVFAGLIANVPSLSWRADYKIGGVLGLVVLVARFSSGESKMFQHMIVQGQADYWRILGFLFRGRNLLKLGYCILAGAPTFFIVGLLAPRSSQFGKALGMTVLPTGPTTLVWTYGGVALGGLVCGAFAQLVRSRKAALLVFHGITFAGFASLLLVPASDPFGLYCRFAVTGVGIGYWANMVTNAAEQWGTNVRGTVTIAVPNFVRLLLVPISFLFGWLEPKLGFTSAAWIVGIVCSVTAVASLRQLKDGFHRDLDFVENLNPNSAAAGLPVNI